MVELKPGVPVYGLLQQMTQLRAQLGNSQSASESIVPRSYKSVVYLRRRQ
jgi:hypothetical protein